MITAGIDMGSKTIKVVILRDTEIVGKGIALAGFENREAAETAYAAALDEAGIGMDDVERVVATGAGRSNAPYAERDISEVASDARAAISSIRRRGP